MNQKCQEELKRLRARLTQFGRRNRELFFKPARLSVDLSEFPYDEDRLDEKGKQLASEFSGTAVSAGSFDELLERGTLSLDSHFQLKKDFSTRPLADGSKTTAIEDAQKRLGQQLNKIRLADRAFTREFGITGAWVLGPFVCWRSESEYHPTELVLSPLFRVPVDIERSKTKRLKLVLEDDTYAVNPSLRLYLRAAWGIELPEYFDVASSAQAIEEFKAACEKAEKTVRLDTSVALPPLCPRRRAMRDEDGEVTGYVDVDLATELSEEHAALYTEVTDQAFVILDRFYLSQINASKMALVDDYDRMLAVPLEHEIVKGLLEADVAVDSFSAPTPAQLEVTPEHKITPVVAIDSTQHRAIVAARESDALVLQGPPGTGKSQTITNIIADSLQRGERVLFVSEKRAALDVVFNRLSKASLGHNAALLHSCELNKSELYKSMVANKDFKPIEAAVETWDAACSSLDENKEKLRAYRECLAALHVASGCSISQVCALAAPYLQGTFNAGLREALAGTNYQQLCGLREWLPKVQREFGQIARNGVVTGWVYKNESVVATEATRQEFSKFVDSLVPFSDAIKEAVVSLNDALPGASLESGEGEVNSALIESLRKSFTPLEIQKFKTLPEARRQLAVLLAAALDSELELEDVGLELEQQIGDSQSLVRVFNASATVAEASRLATFFAEEYGFFAFLNGTFRANRSKGREMLSDPSRYAEGALYEAFVTYGSCFDAFVERLKELGVRESFTLTDYDQLVEFIADFHLVRRAVEAVREIAPVLDPQCRPGQLGFDGVSDLLDKLLSLSPLIESYEEAIKAMSSEAEGYLAWLQQLPPVAGSGFLAVGQKMLEEFELLPLVDQFHNALHSATHSSGIPTLRDLVYDQLLTFPDPWDELVTAELSRLWFDEVQVAHPLLRAFDYTLFNELVAAFDETEIAHRDAARSIVDHSLRVSVGGALSDSAMVALITRESEKKRRLLTPRELMERGAMQVMLALKPVWLMSPLSISQMVPLEPNLFDVVIFDEASQVRVEDAIPSIYRGKRLVVVGDRHQMPPTQFFSAVLDDDEEEEEESAESILDLAQAVYPGVTLGWHYRSKSEALIAYSNRSFYEGALIAPPNPVDFSKNSPIQFVKVEDATFTYKEGNRVEAERVVALLDEHLCAHPERTVGILALGQSQVKAIEEVLEEKVSSDSEFAERLEKSESLRDEGADVGFFVKNLENVQGDERETIILSVGYAPSRPGRKLRKHFGPLSQKGGGRRLNVAVTRAKRSIVVVCSFNPAEVLTGDSAANNNPDTALFVRYLQYAEAISAENTEAALRLLPEAVARRDKSAASLPLASEVSAELEARGHTIVKSLGASGYFLDFAVEHRDRPGEFVLGVECDGPSFRAVPYSRDREKIRELLLASRGWRTTRVWPYQWAVRKHSELERLEGLISEAYSVEETSSIEVPLESVKAGDNLAPPPSEA